MDISEQIPIKLTFDSVVYQQITQQLGIIDSFKGHWNTLAGQHGKYLNDLRKIATVENIQLHLDIPPLNLQGKPFQ